MRARRTVNPPGFGFSCDAGTGEKDLRDTDLQAVQSLGDSPTNIPAISPFWPVPGG